MSTENCGSGKNMKFYSRRIIAEYAIPVGLDILKDLSSLFSRVRGFSRLFYPSRVFPNYPISEPLSYRPFPNCLLVDCLYTPVTLHGY